MGTNPLMRHSLRRNLILPAVCLGLSVAMGCGGGGGQTTTPPIVTPPIDTPRTPDETLRGALATQGVYAPAPPVTQNPAEVELGRMLFFDKVLSSRGDISCSGCHHPTLSMDDAIPLSKGTSGEGLGPDRQLFGDQVMVARNATDVFNRGLPEWRTMLWDARVERLANGKLKTPAGKETPAGLSGVLAAQAIFAMSDDREMHSPQTDILLPFGGDNSPTTGGAMVPPMPPPLTEEDSLTDIWQNITHRVTSFQGYRDLIQAAHPTLPEGSVTIAHLANAIAAFQTEKMTTLDTPFDRYMRGDDAALTNEQKAGGIIFYGKAKCSSCHVGALMTDQEFHNILVPELGPGKAGTPGVDRGRIDISGRAQDNYTFRTPPLRNVSETGPYMHNGSMSTLEQVVRHHLDPVKGFRGFQSDDLPSDLRPTVNHSDGLLTQMQPTLDALLSTPTVLTDEEVDQVISFLEALTDVALEERLKGVEPESVPSNISTSYGEGGFNNEDGTPPLPPVEPGQGNSGDDPGSAPPPTAKP